MCKKHSRNLKRADEGSKENEKGQHDKCSSQQQGFQSDNLKLILIYEFWRPNNYN